VRDFPTAWLTLTSRLSGTGALPENVEPRGWLTTTPPPIESDVWKTFAKEAPDHIRDCKIFSWRLDDNIHLNESYIDMMRATNKTEAQIQAFLNGEWAMAGLGSFKFDYNRHVFMDHSFLPDPEYITQVAYGVDWGYEHAFVIVVILFDKDGRAYIVEEFYQKHFDANNRWIKAKELRDKWGNGTFFCGSDEPFYIKEFQEHGLDARGNRAKRDESIEELAGRFYDWDNRPRIFVYEGCKATIMEFSMYLIENKELDDAVDAVRYGIQGVVGTPNAIIGHIEYSHPKKQDKAGPKAVYTQKPAPIKPKHQRGIRKRYIGQSKGF
jgi:hypothetical protein